MEGRMSDSLVRPDVSLAELLTARARGASDRRLALDVAFGSLAACGLMLWRPSPWVPLLGAAICFLAFGTWGIALRELDEEARADAPSARRQRLLQILRVSAAIAGAVGVGLLLLGGLSPLLGTWIS